MLVAKMVNPGDIVFDNVEMPTINKTEVLIKVWRIGICGSDIHVYHGEHPYTSYPIIQGHEISGEVIKVGEDITKVKPGDKVTVQPQVICGKCYSCQNDDYHICDKLKVMGFQTDGWAREYYKASEEKVLKLPAKMSYDMGALVEPVAVACHALNRNNMSLTGKKVLVLGAGTIGNLVAQIAKAKGAKKVIITDVSDYRLSLAKKCGIDVTVNITKTDLNNLVRGEFGPDKADLIMECVGTQKTIHQAVNIARKGSDIIVVGVYSDEVMINMGFVQDRELRLIGTLMYQEKDYLEAINLLSTNKIKDNLLITDHFTFKDYDKAYQYIGEKSDKVMKVMIDMVEG